MNNIIKKIAVNLRNGWIGFLHLLLLYLSVYCWVGCWWKSNICSEQILSTPSCARKKCCVPGWPLAPRPRVATHSLYCNGVIAWKLCIQINAHPLVSNELKNKRMKRESWWEFSFFLVLEKRGEPLNWGSGDNHIYFFERILSHLSRFTFLFTFWWNKKHNTQSQTTTTTTTKWRYLVG